MTVIDRLSTAYRKLTRPAKKDVPFDKGGGASNVQVMFSSMNDWQNWILRAISPQSEPSDDPRLSSLVAAGWTWLANTVGEPDPQVKKGFLRKQGGKKRDDDVVERHQLYELLSEPNPYFSAAELWGAFAYDWIIAGNVFWLKFRNAFGQVVEIWPEPSISIRARWQNDKQGEYIPAERSQSVPVVERDDRSNQFINYYEVTRNAQPFRIERADVVHFRDVPDPVNRRYGISKMQLILREIFGDSAVANYAARLLGGNGVIPYVLSIDDKEGIISEPDLLIIKAKMLEQTTGANAGNPLVVTARATVQKTGLTPQEMDLKGARHLSEIAFSRVTGIPYQVLNLGVSTEASTYHNMSEADRRAIDQYLTPLWWKMAQTLTRQLLRDIDQDETHFVEFDTSEVAALQEDVNAVWKRLGQAYQDGWLKRSEVRTAADYENDPSGADDVYYVRPGSDTVTLEEEEKSREASLEAMENPPEPEMLPQGQQPRLLTQGQPLRVAK